MDPEKALEVLTQGTEEAEIYFSREETKRIEFRKREMNSFKEEISFGYGIRVLKGGKMGFAFSNSLEAEDLERALEAMKLAKADPYHGLPDRDRRADPIPGTYDPKVPALEPEEVLEGFSSLLDPCSRYRVEPTTGSILWGVSEEALWNSHGLEVKDRGTAVYCSLHTVVPGEDVSGYAYRSSRSFDLDFGAIGEEAARLARESVSPMRIDSMTTPLTLRPDAVSDLLENALIPSFDGENVQRGRSLLAGKVGEALFPREIEIIDDGTLEGGLLSASHDGEGTRAQRTVLVERGVLKGFLFDAYAARKGKTRSTGNGLRESYASLPKITPTNFLLSGRRASTPEEGLLVHGLIGAHTANPTSGDFSVETQNAFYRGRPVKKAILSGNIFDLLSHLVGLGDDARQVGHVRTPSLEFDEVRVVG
jgi:PmbA protein